MYLHNSMLKSFATCNMAGLATSKKRYFLDQFCATNGVDLCAIQESNLVESHINLTYGELIGIPPAQAHAGLTFWISKNSGISDFSLTQVVPDRIIEASFTIEGNSYLLYNMHLPHRDAQAKQVLSDWVTRLKQWGYHIYSDGLREPQKDHLLAQSHVTQRFDKLEPGQPQPAQLMQGGLVRNIIAMGDFNFELERRELDTDSPRKGSVIGLFKDIMDSLGIVNIPLSFISTPAPPTRATSIIDYICIPSGWFSRIQSIGLLSTSVSDHAMVCVTILNEIPPSTPSSFWRYKNELLSSEPYVKSMTTFLTENTRNPPCDHMEFVNWWDDLREQIIKLSKNCWKHLRNQLSTYSQPSTVIRNTVQQILFLKDSMGRVVADQEDILRLIKEYYGDLFSPDTTHIPPKDMTFGLKTVDKGPEIQMDSVLTLDDLYKAATSMNIGKAPGIDGITLEFYLKFWCIMGPLLLESFRHILATSALEGMTSHGVIVLIPKSGDLRMISNWRPISLLTVDLKIIAKAVANKLSPMISAILPSSQTAKMGSSIFSSLSTVRDVISLSTIEKSPLVLLTLDQAKAFDRVNHNFLFHLLEVIGIPSGLLNAVKAIYSGFKCKIRNGGKFSESFSYLRGIRQGDATSSCLFALAIQPFLNIVAMTMEDQGFVLSADHRLLYTAYADDTTFFLQSMDSIPNIVQCFHRVAYFSEASLNLKKSAILSINTSKNSGKEKPTHFMEIPINTRSIRILGIEFLPSTRISNSQWSGRYRKTVLRLARAIPRLKNLTYYGRASWVKLRLWPLWSFLLKVLQPTQAQLTQLTSLLAGAIWLNGKHWTSAKEITLEIEEGGFGALSPYMWVNVMRIMFLSKVCSSDASSELRLLAGAIFAKYAGLSYGLEILHTKPDDNLITTLPPFYASAYLAWNQLPVSIFPKSVEELLILPAVNSKLLNEVEPPIVISVGNAISWNIRTNGDIYHKEPSCTRLSQTIVKGIRAFFDGMGSEFFERPPSIEAEESVLPQLEGNEQVMLKTSFWLVMEGIPKHISKWTKNVITHRLKQREDTDLPEEVNSLTWRTLSKLRAPSPFINATWRVFRNRYNSPSFYFQVRLIPIISCVFCQATDGSRMHQFQLCPIFTKILDLLKSLALTLGLTPLGNFCQLFPATSMDFNFANFLISCFIYTVVNYAKIVVNSQEVPSEEKAFNFFFSTLKNHFICWAKKYPPSIKENARKWDLLTHEKLIAYINGTSLFVFDGYEFRPFYPP